MFEKHIVVFSFCALQQQQQHMEVLMAHLRPVPENMMFLCGMSIFIFSKQIIRHLDLFYSQRRGNVTLYYMEPLVICREAVVSPTPCQFSPFVFPFNVHKTRLKYPKHLWDHTG